MAALETTATYDQETDEFVINTPSKTATKWWAGDNGKFSNHAILMARLIVGKKDYGPQAFLVPIRDMETWEVLPNIQLGELGQKYGFTGKDNGFMIFKNARIPRFNMFSKWCTLSRDGKFRMQGD